MYLWAQATHEDLSLIIQTSCLINVCALQLEISTSSSLLQVRVSRQEMQTSSGLGRKVSFNIELCLFQVKQGWEDF